jgi:hypothetical protein
MWSTGLRRPFRNEGSLTTQRGEVCPECSHSFEVHYAEDGGGCSWREFIPGPLEARSHEENLRLGPSVMGGGVSAGGR